jgi:hypothetical protein
MEIKTWEEYYEMLDANINSNGIKAISGDILNLVFRATADFLKANAGGGSGASASAAQIYTDFNDGSELTEDQKAANAATYAQAKAAYENGTAIPIITVDMSLLYADMVGSNAVKIVVQPFMVGFLDPNDPTVAESGMAGLMAEVSMGSSSISLLVTEDGNCAVNLA